jgi:hypothetical protein
VTSNTNKVKAAYEGTTHAYRVILKQKGSCLTGTLADSLHPAPGRCGAR